MSYTEEINEVTLLAYLNKELDNEDMIKVDRWLIQSSENMDLLNDIREIWKMTGKVSTPVEVDTDSAWSKVRGQISEDDSKVIPITQGKPSRRLFMVIAASLVFMIGLSTVFLFMSPGNETGQLEWSSLDSVESETLEDGSEVTLNQNSSLTYPAAFAENERRVSLKGEAFFDIERNEEKPFVIDLPNKFYVKVLGTSFNIKANDSDTQTEVFVNSGKVEFGSESDKIILIAGEKAIMDNETGKVEKVEEEVETMQEMFWLDKYLKFDGEALEDVLEILNSVYIDQVRLECDEMRMEPVKTTHRDDTMEEVLEAISVSHSMTFEKETTESGTTFFLKCDG